MSEGFVSDKEEKKSNKGLLIAVIALALLVAGFIGVSAMKSAENESVAEPTETVDDTIYGDESLNIDAEVDKQLKEYRNIIICGIDNKHRSDVMMIASINKSSNKVTLFNIYRDTYMQLKKGEPYTVSNGVSREFFKCNHAYKYGGKMAALKEVNLNLDLNCREIIGMDWDTIEMLIDSIDGIDVDVSSDMLQWLTTIHQSGYQHLNGEQAVDYLRTRHDATAVQRAERNEAVFVHVFEKINTMSKTEQVQLLDSIIDMTDSNMSDATMSEILQQITSYELTAGTDFPYDWELYWEPDMSYYYFVPQTLETNVIKLHEKVFGQSDYSVTAACKEISDKIESRRTDYLTEGVKNFGRDGSDDE